MSRPHYGWWGYVKDIIRRYPSMRNKLLTGVTLREYEAVQAAIEQTERMRNGGDRLKVIELVLWRQTHYISGVSLQIPCSEKTAKRYHADFIKAVAQNFRCDSLLD